MDSVYDCCIHTLETPTVVNSACSGRFLAGDHAACCAIAKNSGIVVLKSEKDGATTALNLPSYDRVDHVHTLSVQGVHSPRDDFRPSSDIHTYMCSFHSPYKHTNRSAGLDTDLLLTVTHDLTFTLLAPATGQQFAQVHSTQLNTHTAPVSLSMHNVAVSQPVTVWKNIREQTHHTHIVYIAVASHSAIWILDLRISVCTRVFCLLCSNLEPFTTYI